MIVVVDTGGIDALVPADEKRRARLGALIADDSDLILPATVLAEGVFNNDRQRTHNVIRLLKSLRVQPIDETLGKAAGALRHAALAAGATPSGVDATVAAVADAQAAGGGDVTILTSDVGDIAALIAHAKHASKLTARS